MKYNKYYPSVHEDGDLHFYADFSEESRDLEVDFSELSQEFNADFVNIMTNHTNSIYTGTDLTGTGTNIPYVIPSSLGGDLYVNVSTWNVYKAVATSVWDYVGNIKGAKGDTGSTGATGNGISSAVLNGDYTLTLNFTDGTSYTTTSIRGAQGETGATGNGISSIVQNADDTLTITMTNGTTYTTSPVKGDKGDTGTAATIAVGTVTKGANASVTNTGTSSAAVFDFVLPKGDKGDTGATGATGATGNGIASITKTGTVGLIDTYTITFTNGTTTTFTVTNGEDGAGQVESVNGKTGVVVLDADDVGALPDNTSIPSKTSDLTNDSGFITTETDPTVPSWAKASTKPTYTAQEVGALPSSTSIPSKTSDLTNDSGYITSAQAPVTSVNGMTGDVTVVSGVTSVNGQSGAVVLDADDVGALPDDTSIPSATSDLLNDSGFVSSQQTEKIFVQGTTPSTASDGDIWIDTATQSASGIAYLPLSAGSDHPLSGDLHLVGTTIRMERSDRTTDLRIYESSSGGYVVQIGAGGIYMDDTGYVTIYGNGENIWLRPNGAFNSNGQVYFDTTGQQHGGHGRVYGNASKAVAATTSTEITSFTLPEGTWQINSYMDSNTGNTSSYNHTVSLPNSVRTVRSTMNNGGGSCNCFSIKLTAQHTFVISGYAPVACTLRVKYDAVQLG